MSNCEHNPKCRFNCRVCNGPLPEHGYLPKEGATVAWHIVHYENGVENRVLAPNAYTAMAISNVELARAASLCLKHLVRVKKVVDHKPFEFKVL